MPQIAYTFSKNDEWYTPAYAVYPIIQFLKPESVIWCPFDTAESEFVKVLKKHNFKVIFSHILSGGGLLHSRSSGLRLYNKQSAI